MSPRRADDTTISTQYDEHVCNDVNPGWCVALAEHAQIGVLPLCCARWSNGSLTAAYSSYLLRTVDVANAWLKSPDAMDVFRSETRLIRAHCAPSSIADEQLCVSMVAARTITPSDHLVSVLLSAVIDAVSCNFMWIFVMRCFPCFKKRYCCFF